MTFLHFSRAENVLVAKSAKLPAILVVLCSLVAFPAYGATPCVVPIDCTNVGPEFCVDGFCCDVACNGRCDACSAAKKGGGVDGVCGLATEGSTCKSGYCNGDTFSFVGPSKCTATGVCTEPTPVNCLEENPCKLDLCGDTGCEHLLKPDGIQCGNGMTCLNGTCGMGSASSSSGSGSSSSSGVGGAGGSAGAGGIGGKGGSGEMGGMGGTASSSSSGQVNPYPPSTGKGCTCSTVENSSSTGPTTVLFAAIAMMFRRFRRAGDRSF